MRKETVSDGGDRRSGCVTCGGMREETEVGGEEMCKARGIRVRRGEIGEGKWMGYLCGDGRRQLG